MKKTSYMIGLSLAVFTLILNSNLALSSSAENELTADQKSISEVNTTKENSDDSDKNLKTELNDVAKKIGNKKAALNTTINFNSPADTDNLSKEAKDYLDNLKDCKEYKAKFQSTRDASDSEKEIIGQEDNVCKTREIFADGKELTCAFPMDRISEVVDYYTGVFSNQIGGKYNIDLDMKFPEINFSDLSSDKLDLDVKFELPKVKIDKVKSPVEELIEEVCK